MADQTTKPAPRSQADEALRRVRQPAVMSAADRAAHEAASYVRPLPREPRARRRVIALRKI